MAKKKLSYGSTKLTLDMRKIYQEFSSIGFVPDERLSEGSLTKMLEESANKMVNELNKRSSMRETQGAGNTYFTHQTINRAVYDRPFSTAKAITSKTSTGISVTVTAPIKSTSGQQADLIDILQSGRPQKKMPNGKVIVFPAIQKGSERLIKKRLGNVYSIKGMFRAGKAKYKKRNGKLVMVVLGYLPAVAKRDILGVIARSIEADLEKQKIKIPSLGISGNIGKGLVKVEVNE